MTRAAIYARYSSDLQSDASIEDQVRLCRERGAAERQEIVEVFSDHAISGGHLKNRPGMLALLESARAGSFDVLIAEALDRISRDQEDIAAIFKRLAHADVSIVTLTEGPISELHVGLKGTMNALFLKDLADKTRRGQRGRVEAGKIPGGNSYGYRIIRSMRKDGSVTTGEREIDPEQAAIILRIFEEYARGAAPRSIAARLNAECIPSPRGGLWNASTINGSRQRRNGILNNELYIGRIIYNRQRFVKDPESGKRVSRLNPPERWAKKDVPHLRIVDTRTWDAVQSIKSRYSSHAGNKRQSKKRLLSGLVRCSNCGGALTIINRERYSCSAKRERGTCSSPAGIQAKALEDRVINGLRSILFGRDDLIEEFAEAFRAEVNRLRRTHSHQHRALQQELQKVEKGIARCLNFITGGDGDPGSVRATLRELEGRKHGLAAKMKAEPPSDIAIHPNIAELYRRKVENLQTLLTDETSRAEAMEIIRSMIDRIEVSPGTKRGEPDVLLVGALASILGYASAPKQDAAIISERGVCRVLLVAGAGFEPATFRL
jgi:site-specific DNA recombinase